MVYELYCNKALTQKIVFGLESNSHTIKQRELVVAVSQKPQFATGLVPITFLVVTPQISCILSCCSLCYFFVYNFCTSRHNNCQPHCPKGEGAILNQTENFLPPSSQFLLGTMWSGNETSGFPGIGLAGRQCSAGSALRKETGLFCMRQVCKYDVQIRDQAVWQMAALFLI